MYSFNTEIQIVSIQIHYYPHNCTVEKLITVTFALHSRKNMFFWYNLRSCGRWLWQAVRSMCVTLCRVTEVYWHVGWNYWDWRFCSI